jgi:thymidylate synthase
MSRLVRHNMRKFYSQEGQYLNLIKNTLIHGKKKETRNGKTLSLIGESMRFSLKNNKIPLMTTKQLAWKTCLKELIWFINGETDNEVLQKQNVKIWNGNGSREFLDSRGLSHYNENDLGPIYGYQWRHFNRPYDNKEKHYRNKYLDDCLNTTKHDTDVDQLQIIIDSLKDKKERFSRRLIMTAWNPLQLHQMALPPCHILSQFCVNDDELSCILYQRSGDVGLGIPFNIASYSFLTILLAHHCGLKPGEFIHHIGDAHIYEEHVDALNTQLLRMPFDIPTCKILTKHQNIEDYVVEDFKINNYIHHGKIDMNMKA